MNPSRLIATVSDEKVSGYNKITLPIIREYAERCGAEFMNLTEPYDGGPGMWNYRTLVFAKLLNKYGTILYMDSDILINKGCPNIFDVVPVGKMAGVFEDVGSRKKERRERIKKINDFYGDIGEWNSGFMNGGFYVVWPKNHWMFHKINGKLWGNPGFDSGHFSYQIGAYKIPFHNLGYKWNHMTMFSEPWNGKADRFKSYIIHYAGKGIFDKDVKTKNEQIAKDAEKIYG